jgi:hypothetical protein
MEFIMDFISDWISHTDDSRELNLASFSKVGEVFGASIRLKSLLKKTPLISKVSDSVDKRTKQINRDAQFIALIKISSKLVESVNDKTSSEVVGLRILDISSFFDVEKIVCNIFSCLHDLGRPWTVEKKLSRKMKHIFRSLIISKTFEESFEETLRFIIVSKKLGFAIST